MRVPVWVSAHREGGNRARARDRRDNEGKWLLLRSYGFMDLLAWTPLTNFSRDVLREARRAIQIIRRTVSVCLFGFVFWHLRHRARVAFSSSLAPSGDGASARVFRP